MEVLDGNVSFPLTNILRNLPSLVLESRFTYCWWLGHLADTVGFPSTCLSICPIKGVFFLLLGSSFRFKIYSILLLDLGRRIGWYLVLLESGVREH